METKKKINNVSSTVKSSGWGKLEDINFDYTFESGTSKNLTFEIYGKSDGIGILLYNPKKNTVILSKQFRVPVYVHGISDGFSIEVVGGAIDENESPESAAIRETEEEVGYKIDNVKRISTVFLSPGIVNEKVHLFIGEYADENKTENGGGVIAEDEEIEVLETEFSDALKMIETEEIIDARTIMLLQYLQINKLLKY
ncbi:NUDIX domain-containing protein [Polaribacter reichenbachii]|uniref:GDP-mannose pyrophosphatase n=1 Tax=Polaribacter reichenbachii TaxID=996801 RepID=A0A1B8U466_9FLAO|nr:NUDIX domain-containing protein [Polaribacter reichenbachii]APZ48198.1 NUDIX domain-containing protein [Polaribacter reichenbachii]AUC20469.1 NUDIX domain-containing protein [Polaribacter reichenbachii]OBY66647.1 DNA mismatch repair protein MutT [Polaribacter reichenbachii]